MHAALRCLGMRVRLRVTEGGNARCAPCTDGATIMWAAPPYDEGKAIFRDHAQLCTISATSGSLLPVVPWGGEESVCGAGRFHWHLLNKLCYGHLSLIQRALIPAAAPTQRMWTRLFPKGICCYRDHGGFLCCFCCWSEAQAKETACRPGVSSCAHHCCHAAAAFRGECTAVAYRFAWSARLRVGGDRCPLHR
ncbi:hypothetical protein TcCL_NonESM10479 [Trypanosoma cruzi]|nr:hypothetical protein TcCL_NonESM10479 [Trypanosoma cruzi]